MKKIIGYNDMTTSEEDAYYDEICYAKGELFQNLWLKGFDPDIFVPGIMNADQFNGIMDKRMTSVLGPRDASLKTIESRAAD